MLVVGGAGSIGSELVSQLLRLGASDVAVADSSELGVYQLGQAHEGESRLRLHLVDAKDRTPPARVFAAHRPDVVFHAAAYKQCRSVERSHAAARRAINNVLAMRNCVAEPTSTRVKKFVLISTDKAVDP